MATALRKLSKFVRLVKVDKASKTVFGIMAEEIPDLSGEIFDYETSKSFVKAWSDKFAKATSATGAETSYGNLRFQHTSKVAGALRSIDFLDAEKQVYIGAEVTDEDTWNMVLKGVLTGFSLGGYYVKTWKDGKYVKYTADIMECSVVDYPCGKTSYFDVVGGTTGEAEKIQFIKSTNPLVQKVIFEFLSGSLKKSMYSVSDLAYVLSYLNSCRMNIKYEEEYEQDGSDIAERLVQVVDSLAVVLQDYLQEETAELTADARETAELAAPAGGDLEKSKTEPEEIEMDAKEFAKAIKDGITDGNAELSKQLTGIAQGQELLATEIEAIKKNAEGTDQVVAALATTITKLGSSPAIKGAPSVRIIEKGQEETAASATAAVPVAGGSPAIKTATPETEEQGRVNSLNKLKEIHKTAGVIVPPGSSKFMRA